MIVDSNDSDSPEISLNNYGIFSSKVNYNLSIDALYKLRKLNSIHFWHQNDDYTLTSNGYFWTFPGKKLNFRSICVLPELAKYKNINCSGICSDYIEKYKIV